MFTTGAYWGCEHILTARLDDHATLEHLFVGLVEAGGVLFWFFKGICHFSLHQSGPNKEPLTRDVLVE